jgi:hypothetical protein
MQNIFVACGRNDVTPSMATRGFGLTFGLTVETPEDSKETRKLADALLMCHSSSTGIHKGCN